MSKTFLISDTHFGHEGTASIFKREDGSPLRPFKNAAHQDEVMIENWNRVVSPDDRVYHLGDFCMARRHLSVLDRLNGRIAIVLGNHDPWGIADWVKHPNVTHVLGYKVYPEHGLILSHVPVSERQLEGRFRYNIHGHTHDKFVKDSKGHPDPRYIPVCVEHIDYTPIDLDVILKRLK